jgi:hypothetical protein
VHKGQTVLIRADGDVGTLVLDVARSQTKLAFPRRVHAIAFSGDPDPSGGRLGQFAATALLSSRRVAFANYSDGVFIRDGGSLVEAALAGDATPLGGSFRALGRPALAWAPAAQPPVAVFHGLVNGGTSTEGIFRWEAGALTAVVAWGDPAPGGDTFWRLGRAPAVSLGPSTAFFARVGRTDGVFRDDGGLLSSIIMEGDPSPCGGTIRTISREWDVGPSISPLGSIAFYARSRPGGDGIFVAAPGGPVVAVACEDDPSPIDGEEFDWLGENPVVAPGPDLEVVFPARAGDVFALFRWAGGSLTKLVATGDKAAPSGSVFFVFPEELRVGMNTSGQLAFSALLTSLDIGIFLLDIDGDDAPWEIAREGDPCPIGGTIAEILADEVGLSETGEVVFAASCTGGDGILQGSREGPLEVLASFATTTSAGPHRFSVPSSGAPGQVAFEGTRSSILLARCGSSGCDAPVAVAALGDPIAERPGEFLSSIYAEKIVGSGKTTFFLGEAAGSQRRTGIFSAENGVTRAVVLYGDPLPGGGAVGDLGVRISESKRQVAFLARLGPFQRGILLARGERVGELARTGGPAPGGGTFASLGFPSISGKTVAFLALLSDDRVCIEALELSGAGEHVICVDDPAPDGVAGTVIGLSDPVAGRGRLFFSATVNDGSGDDPECLFERKGEQVRALACSGAPVVGSRPDDGVMLTFSEGIDPLGEGRAASGSRVASRISTAPGYGTLVVLRRGVVSHVAVVDRPCPVGGTYSFVGSGYSLRGRSVAFSAGLVDEGTTRAILFARLAK